MESYVGFEDPTEKPECLPFAMGNNVIDVDHTTVVNGTSTSTASKTKTNNVSKLNQSSSSIICETVGNSSSVPLLASSIVSTPTAGDEEEEGGGSGLGLGSGEESSQQTTTTTTASVSFSDYASSSLLQPGSQFLDTAASLLPSNSFITSTSSSTTTKSAPSIENPASSTDKRLTAASTRTANATDPMEHSMGFSQLMRKAAAATPDSDQDYDHDYQNKISNNNNDDDNNNINIGIHSRHDERKDAYSSDQTMDDYTTPARRLPVLPEEASLSSVSSGNNNAGFGGGMSSFLQPNLARSVGQGTTSTTRAAAAAATQWRQTVQEPLQRWAGQVMSTLQQQQHSILISPAEQRETSDTATTAANNNAGSIHHVSSLEHRLALLAGAQVVATGPRSFQACVSFTTTPECELRHVIDIISNPDLLRLWCEPITGPLVITHSSEGAPSTVTHHYHHHRSTATTTATGTAVEPNRQYEGEWIEATTTTPLRLPSRTSCVYSTSRTIKHALGFPTLGKVTMFVERQRRQIALTIGPFAGGLQVHHRIKVTLGDWKTNNKNNNSSSNKNNNNERCSPTATNNNSPYQRIYIRDDVRVKPMDNYNDDNNERSCMSSLERMLFLPSTNDYVDQVLASLARLRFLVENGEVASAASVNTTTSLPQQERTAPSSTIDTTEASLREPLIQS